MKKVLHRSKTFKNRKYKLKKQKELREEWENFLDNFLNLLVRGKGSV